MLPEVIQTDAPTKRGRGGIDCGHDLLGMPNKHKRVMQLRDEWLQHLKASIDGGGMQATYEVDVEFKPSCCNQTHNQDASVAATVKVFEVMRKCNSNIEFHEASCPQLNEAEHEW